MECNFEVQVAKNIAVEKLAKLIPKMSEREQENITAFIEGIAFAKDLHSNKKLYPK